MQARIMIETFGFFANLVVDIHKSKWALWLPTTRDSEDDINDYVNKYSFGRKSWCSKSLA